MEPPPEGYLFLMRPLPVQRGRATSGFLIGILLVLRRQAEAQGAGILRTLGCNPGQELQKSVQLYQVGDGEGRTICSGAAASEAAVEWLKILLKQPG